MVTNISLIGSRPLVQGDRGINIAYLLLLLVVNGQVVSASFETTLTTLTTRFITGPSAAGFSQLHLILMPPQYNKGGL